ncbi:TPA: hypothetical protein OT927_004924 [Klebsiella pneumoniae]|nr:hypothetical protein [Klebsiella pneumoniae]
MREAKILDILINRIARNHFKRQAHRTTNSHELHQFASLFDSDYLKKLAQLFIKTDKNSTDGLHSHYYIVEAGWIDKKPLVAFPPALNLPKVELGDALLIYSNQLVDKERKFISVGEERALIIQAKITGNKLRLPKVTVTSGESSKKEFELYSKWPSFMLKNKSGYTSLFNLPHPLSKSQPYPYAFYLAARKSYSKNPDWRCHWMGAPSKKTERCNISAGDILLGLKTGLPVSNYQVGADLKSNPEWARLVRAVLMYVSSSWTNKGWCGVTMPTRIKGSHLTSPNLYLPKKYLRTNIFNMGFNSSLINLFPDVPVSWGSLSNSIKNGPSESDFSGKLMILRVTRISSEFPFETKDVEQEL